MAKENRVVTIDDEQDKSAAQPVNAPEAKEVVGANHDDQLCGDKVKIEIHEGSDDNDKHDVFVQINGYAYSIKRGVEVVVPVEVLHVLENATMTKYATEQGGGQSERKTKRFAYSILGNVPKKAA